MNKLKKVFVLVLIVAVVSLGLAGCKDKSEHEHPTGGEHPTNGTVTDGAAKCCGADPSICCGKKAVENATKDHPAGEHPK